MGNCDEIGNSYEEARIRVEIKKGETEMWKCVGAAIRWVSIRKGLWKVGSKGKLERNIMVRGDLAS